LSQQKIYSDDPLVHYKNSAVNPERTKAEIDGVLAEWQVTDVYWHWNPQANDIYVMFKINETIKGVPLKVSVRIDCPIVWDKARSRRRPYTLEQVNLRISMRAMWWYIKTHLEMAYVTHSSKTVAFLPNIAGVREGQTLKDIIIPRLVDIQNLVALEEKQI